MKKLLSFMTAAAMGVCTIGFMPEVFSQTEIHASAYSGTCGEGVTWVLENGELTISGTGSIADYVYSSETLSTTSPWSEYSSTIKKVYVNDGVTGIGDYAFYSCSNLQLITMTDSVTSIGDSAFYGCESIAEIQLPEKINAIGDFAFFQCTSLASITIPETMTNIGENVFAECTALKTITILNENCTITDSESTVYSGASICGHIGSAAETYAGKYSRDFISISKRSGTCGANLSWELDGETLTISGTGDMYDFEFVSDSTPTSAPWCDYRIYVKNIVIEEGVTNIGKRAFKYFVNLKSVEIPESVTVIERSAFDECTSLASVTLPGTLQTIDAYAFFNCSSLKSITIPYSVNSIGEDAFYGCTSLAKIYIYNTDCTIYDSADTIYSGAVIYGYSPSPAKDYADKYSRTFTGSSFSDSGVCGTNVKWGIDESKLIIYGTGAMTNYSSYTNVPWYSFRNSIKSVVIKNGVTSIGFYAFRDCDSLTSVTIADSVTKINYEAFRDCGSLKSITLPESVASIGSLAFYYGALTSITIKNPNCSIYDHSDTIRNYSSSTYVTIYGYKGSTAEAYANKYSYKTFSSLGDAPSITTTTTTTTPETIIVRYGDTNLDDSVGMLDLVYLEKNLAGIIKFNAQQKANADCTADGSITSSDASVLFDYLVKKIDSLPLKA